MKFSSVAVAASMALTASAQPTAPETFGLIAIHSGSGVQNSGFNAALGSVFAGLSGQNATCEGSDDGFATFYIKDEALFLYGPSGSTQQVYVDRSGMGQGKLGYTTGDESGPRNGERTGWAIDNSNHLQFDGSSLIACPNSIGGAYSIWVSAGVANPGGNENCVGIAARVEKTEKPVPCTYS
ncbi:hypothetical protein ASPSYDRAFT_35513 [Aspergillus sydowii CBS 593.65]|uniref:Cell wall protein PhiA n=1 Tax=Aspergillus sydowii CBS 593.65 TaxID=1036612 RepID=A0A1L9T5X5_9EURO|nr:uncharacterized protein ASPSYDRAFT_35513 [Aspergillus sydowii CBS 593.65]OJJ54844.1 hypothetical protein ASPSYDRAFT_35513 [Aspergillus sydowii CBS 593.65]